MKILRRILCSMIVADLLFVPSFAGLAQAGDDEVTPQVQELYTQAKAAQQQGDDVTAIAKYREILKLAPHLAAAYNNLGMLYFNEKDYTHAAEVLEHGLKVNAKMPTATAMLGMSYFQLGQSEKAEPLLKAALRANPTDDRAEMMLAHNQIKLGKLEEATKSLNDVLARNPKD